MSKDAALGASIALVAALLGAVLSFFPLYIIGLRDAASQNQTAVGLLAAEKRAAESLCSSIPTASGEAGANNSFFARSMVPAAWEAVSAQGDFVDSIDIDEWSQISTAYSELAQVQASASALSTYSATQRAMENYGATVYTMLSDVDSKCADMTSEFDTLDPLYDRLEHRFGTRVMIWNCVIGILLVLAIAVVVGACFWLSRVLRKSDSPTPSTVAETTPTQCSLPLPNPTKNAKSQ